MSRRLTISTLLDAKPDLVWQHVNTPRLHQYVARPFLSFTPVEPSVWPKVWDDGDYLASMKLGGALPIGRQTISISRPAPEGSSRFLRDNGHSPSIKRWDHLITIRPEGQAAYYEDQLDLDAGLRTPLVAAFSKRFYTHRQARWRELVSKSFDYGRV
ncbi:hypothetical protein [Parvularcula maris]|uniref:Uncharacterized protein n=1 Tax=Parvularcula maris TaxID=2965077 RepID=A0A9X2L978_9PROT|nr:hypothetical protein [Parvularcula maris]MCQ8185352.1 hypothetical protein [Parvularcula maris]